MRISIFGLGYVGCISAGCLASSGHYIVGVDVDPKKVELLDSGKPTIIEKDIEAILTQGHALGRIRATLSADEAVNETELSFVCVGTPSTAKGHLDLRYVFEVASQIGESLRKKEGFHTVVVRSTVLPGTCEKIADVIEQTSGRVRNTQFAVVANPEFLREGSAVTDYYNPPLTLIGSDGSYAASIVSSIYEHLPAEVVLTDWKIAELSKYLNNTFHALKISFANEVGNICSELGIDSHEVMNVFCKDTQLNISAAYLKPGFAFGGSCLPKDLKALQTLAHDLYVQTPVIAAIGATNDMQISRAFSMLEPFLDKKMGFLGLGFKEGTDDLRNSPAVRLIERLLGRGARITIYDPNINLTLLTGANKAYIESRIPHLAGELTGSVQELINESDVVVVATKEKAFGEGLRNEFGKTIIDLVRLDDSFLGRRNYRGINWGGFGGAAPATVAEEDTVRLERKGDGQLA